MIGSHFEDKVYLRKISQFQKEVEIANRDIIKKAVAKKKAAEEQSKKDRQLSFEEQKQQESIKRIADRITKEILDDKSDNDLKQAKERDNHELTLEVHTEDELYRHLIYLKEIYEDSMFSSDDMYNWYGIAYTLVELQRAIDKKKFRVLICYDEEHKEYETEEFLRNNYLKEFINLNKLQITSVNKLPKGTLIIKDYREKVRDTNPKITDFLLEGFNRAIRSKEDIDTIIINHADTYDFYKDRARQFIEMGNCSNRNAVVNCNLKGEREEQWTSEKVHNFSKCYSGYSINGKHYYFQEIHKGVVKVNDGQLEEQRRTYTFQVNLDNYEFRIFDNIESTGEEKYIPTIDIYNDSFKKAEIHNMNNANARYIINEI